VTDNNNNNNHNHNHNNSVAFGSMSDTEETFDSLEDEVQYWKLKYTDKSLELVELEEEFDEYRKYTKEVEVCPSTRLDSTRLDPNHRRH
jgi:hypothetical protein